MNDYNSKEKTQLRIFAYGKNALDDIRIICPNIDLKLEAENEFKKILRCRDKIINYEYYIVNGEINEERNNLIKDYLLKDFNKENMAKANQQIGLKIKELRKKYGLEKQKSDNNAEDDSKIDESSEDDDDTKEKSYALYNEELSEETTKILLEYRNFFDIVVIFVDNLLDKDSELAFKYFQGFTNIKSQQPFIFFLTKKDKNPDVTSLFKFYTYEYFDKRNVFAYKFPDGEEEKLKINNDFLQCMNYYHEIGTNDSKNTSQTFNILICGRAGVGKSCFINQFINKKVAKEGEGLSITHEISNYKHPKYKIKIFDTPGFEDNNTVEAVYRTIKKFEKDIRDSRNHLDLILYFNSLSKRNFYAFENKLLKHLIKQQKKLIFVLNDHEKNSKKEIARLKGVFQTSLSQITDTIKEKNDKYIEQILKNIVVINLKQYIYEDDDDENETTTIKIKQPFGMDELFNKIYEILKDHTISKLEIEDAKNVKDIENHIKKFDLLKHIQKIEDVHINIKIECANLILSYARYDFFVWFFMDKRRKELLEKINAINKGSEITNYDHLLTNLKNEVEQIPDKKKEIKDFFDSMNRFKGYFETQGFNFDAYFYYDYTFLIGLKFFNRFKNDYGEYDETSKKFLIDLIDTFNQSIKDFKTISEEWKQTYTSLKQHKTEQEWIKKFFIIEEPKKIDSK